MIVIKKFLIVKIASLINIMPFKILIKITSKYPGGKFKVYSGELSPYS